MATLEEEISALKARIEGYEQEYASAATTEARKDSLLAAITAKEARLTALLQQQARQEAPGKKLEDGLPCFNQTITTSPGSVPRETDHAPCDRNVLDFPALFLPSYRVLNGKNDAWGKVGQGKDFLVYSSEFDIVHYVRIYLENILEAMELNLRISAEIAVKQIRPDLCVLLLEHQLVGVVEVKKPGSAEQVDSILLQKTVLGELLDQMLLVEGFYGMGPVCGILTTGEEWLVAWFEQDNTALRETTISKFNSLCTPEKTSASKSSASEKNSPTGTTPSQKCPLSHHIVEEDEDADDTTEIVLENPRCLNTTRVFKQQNKDDNILELLYSAFSVMANAHLNHRPGVSRCLFKFYRDKHTVTWHPASHEDVYCSVNFSKFPRKNTSVLIALEDLGRGSTGKAWLCVTLTKPQSAVCVLKFSNKEPSDLDKECENWGEIYPEFEDIVRVEEWSGSKALMMPHFATITDEQRPLFKDAIAVLLQAKFDDKKLVHPDVKWRNIGHYQNKGLKVPVIFDLHDVRRYEENRDQDWMETAINKLYSRSETENNFV